MALLDLCNQAYKLPLRDRLVLVDAIIRSIQDEVELSVKIQPGLLSELRGMAKRSGTPPTDEELQAEYVDYLSEKYQ